MNAAAGRPGSRAGWVRVVGTHLDCCGSEDGDDGNVGRRFLEPVWLRRPRPTDGRIGPRRFSRSSLDHNTGDSEDVLPGATSIEWGRGTREQRVERRRRSFCVNVICRLMQTRRLQERERQSQTGLFPHAYCLNSGGAMLSPLISAE